MTTIELYIVFLAGLLISCFVWLGAGIIVDILFPRR